MAAWDEIPLEELCEPGGLVRGPFGGSLKKSDFVPSGYQVYEQRHAINRTTDGARYFITSKKYADMKRFAVRPGDLIVSCSGTIGRIFEIPWSAPAGVINQALLKLRLNPSIVDPDYFIAYFRWNGFQAQILDSTQGGAMQNLVGMPIFRKSLIALPRMKEQQAISDVARDFDALISALVRLIAKKQAIKLGVTQQLLTGMTRLPGFAEPWQRTAIGELLEFKNGLNKASEYFGSGTPIVNFMDVMNATFITAAELKGRVTLTRDETQRFSARRGDIFFTRTSETVEEVGTAAVLIDDVPDACFSGFLLRGRPRSPNCDARFLAYLFQVQSVRRQVASAASYTTRALTNGRSLGKIVVQLPSLEEQRAISGVLTDCEHEITSLRAWLAKSQHLKQGMTQELLSGHTRLPVEETAA